MARNSIILKSYIYALHSILDEGNDEILDIIIEGFVWLEFGPFSRFSGGKRLKLCADMILSLSYVYSHFHVLESARDFFLSQKRVHITKLPIDKVSNCEKETFNTMFF